MSETDRPRTLDPANTRALCNWLEAALGASSVTIRGLEILGGGAVQENWRLDVTLTGGPRAGEHTWVLRTDAAARLPLSLDRASEFAVLDAARRHGVRVAEPIVHTNDDAIIGRPFLIQAWVSGIAQARRIVRDPALASYGEALAEELGAELARLHRITPSSSAGLPFLALPMRPAGRAEVQRLRTALDGASEPRPALEYVLAWLDANAPERRPLVLVHGDYRTGNYLAEEGRLAAILDWEFAHWGDRHEDVGWFCAPCWRFGAPSREAGGIATRAAFYRGYNSMADEPLDERVIPYWEVHALAKWATVALLQGDRFRTGGEMSIELALTGLMPPEMELDALDMIERFEARRALPWR